MIDLDKVKARRCFAGCDVQIGRLREVQSKLPDGFPDELLDGQAFHIKVPAQPAKGLTDAIEVTLPLAPIFLETGSDHELVSRVMEGIGYAVLPSGMS